MLYESDSLLAQVLAAHYGEPHTVFKKLEGEGGMLQVGGSSVVDMLEKKSPWKARKGA